MTLKLSTPAGAAACSPAAQEPRRVVDRYAAGEGSEDGGEPKAFVSVNWLLTEQPLDLETELVGLQRSKC